MCSLGRKNIEASAGGRGCFRKSGYGRSGGQLTDGFDEKAAMQAVEKGGFHMKERDAAKQQTYRVEGMHCAACSAAVERY